MEYPTYKGHARNVGHVTGITDSVFNLQRVKFQLLVHLKPQMRTCAFVRWCPRAYVLSTRFRRRKTRKAHFEIKFEIKSLYIQRQFSIHTLVTSFSSTKANYSLLSGCMYIYMYIYLHIYIYIYIQWGRRNGVSSRAIALYCIIFYSRMPTAIESALGEWRVIYRRHKPPHPGCGGKTYTRNSVLYVWVLCVCVCVCVCLFVSVILRCCRTRVMLNILLNIYCRFLYMYTHTYIRTYTYTYTHTQIQDAT